LREPFESRAKKKSSACRFHPPWFDAKVEARVVGDAGKEGWEAEIEVRPIRELEDLGDNHAVQRFRELGVGFEK
jgi:hypothetical protein